ncbi:MAG: ExbD/TolR family protein [Gemmatimonadota bacterium]
MGLKGGGFGRKNQASQDISTAGLADIVFLLLIFFMVSTVFRTTREIPIEWAEAEAAEKIDEKRENIVYIWVEQDGTVYVNDRPYALPEISDVVAPLYSETDRRLVTSIRADRDTPYQYIDQVQLELQEAGVVRVVFATEVEQRMQRVRR